jgi:hypothetical protein
MILGLSNAHNEPPGHVPSFYLCLISIHQWLQASAWSFQPPSTHNDVTLKVLSRPLIIEIVSPFQFGIQEILRCSVPPRTALFSFLHER